MISRRRCSMSSSGPMHTAAILRCGPTTCSSAAMNSSASRPCVTNTMPIIEVPSFSECVRMNDRRTRSVLAAVRNEVAMQEPAVAAARVQPRGEALGEINGAVTPAGAADGDGQVALAFALVAREQGREHVGEAVEKSRAAGIALDEFGDRAIPP